MIAIVAGAILAALVGSLDYLFLGTAKDRLGVLGALFPSPSAYPDMPLEEIEARIAELMEDQGYRRESGPPRRLEIDGCLVTFTTRDHGRQICDAENASYWKTQELFDLRLLITDPRKVTVRPIAHPRSDGAAAIRIPVHKEASQLLGPMRRLFSAEMHREIRQDSIDGTYDLPARMDRLGAFERDHLTDRLFEKLGQRVHYCKAGVVQAPSANWDAVTLFTSEEHARQVIELFHAYAIRECPFDHSVLNAK